KFTGSGGTLEETVTKNNLEAAEEIVRQLRLRDIGGIIVIDFIDMVLESNRDLVLRRLVECLGRDRTRHQVAEVTSLGLVQMTRKRVGQGLVEAFSEPCEHRGGRGFIVHEHPVEKGSGSSAPAGEGGNRRRKQRGAAPTGGRPAEVAAPAPAAAPVSDDPEAVAAREAVKATLATIAAAAAQAHAEDEDGTSTDAAPDAAPAQDTAPAQEKASRRERAPEPGTVPLPAARTSEPTPDASRSVEEVRASLEALAAALPAGREDA